MSKVARKLMEENVSENEEAYDAMGKAGRTEEDEN